MGNEADSTKKKLQVESQDLNRQIDEEAEKKNDVLKALSKAQAEIQLWKSKYETEALGRIDELEGGKSKLAAKVAEAEEHIENLNSKISSAEKSKLRMESELEENNEQLDIVRRENKNLADEIKDLLDQLGDGGRSIHELDKQRR